MASVSVERVDTRRFKVRWREWVREGGTPRQVARSLTVESRESAIELQARVLRAVETQGFYEPEGRISPQAANLETAAAEWLKHKAARGAAPGTIRKYGRTMARFFATVRQVRGIGAEAPVATTVLSRPLFSDAILAWRAAGLSEATVYGTASTALDMWSWVADDPAAYPGVPSAPRDPTTVLPLPPIYTAPTPPTLAEADACLRQIKARSHVSRAAAILMRFTGLRVSQVLALPFSPHLVAELIRWRAGRSPENYVVRRRNDQRARDTESHIPAAILTAAWEAATGLGEARRETWAPATRKLARPDHAFRAAFMAHLEAAGVRDSVIDFLVGHAPASTRHRHYGQPGMDQLREAVGNLPPIDWRVPSFRVHDAAEFRRGHPV
jgi:integrase